MCDADLEWITVSRPRRDARPIGMKYMSEDEAKALERKLNIWGLKDALVSAESHRLQREGFVFERVITGDDREAFNVDETVILLPIEGSKWGDEIVFVKK